MKQTFIINEGTDDIVFEPEIGIKNNYLLIDTIPVNNSILQETFDESDEVSITGSSWDKSINETDKIDYLLSVSSGLLAGVIDSFFVGRYSIEDANAWGAEKASSFVQNVAHKWGYKEDGDLQGAIKFLEEKFPSSFDKLINDFGGGLQHHLRDFSHHPTLFGLLCSILCQFTGHGLGTDTAGNLIFPKIPDKALIGKNVPEKILFGTINWFFHLVSDMAGSSASPGKGTGIPGPILSLVKELSSLPFFQDASQDSVNFRVYISKMFNGTALAKRDEAGKIVERVRFDLRSEIGTAHHVAKMAVPVLANEVFVRFAYFARRLYLELKENPISNFKELKQLNWERILPFRNRTIIRMVTIASGTFAVADAVDAAIRAAIKSKGAWPVFLFEFALRINVIGVARFAIAIGTDSKVWYGYAIESIDESRKKENEAAKDYIDFDLFDLSERQQQIMYSLMRRICEYDCSFSRSKNKKLWLDEWTEKLSSELRVDDTYFLSDDEIYRMLFEEVDGDMSLIWLYNVTVELSLFSPYCKLDSDYDKNYARLKCKNDYLDDVFCNRQRYIYYESIEAFRKSSEKYSNKIAATFGEKLRNTLTNTALAVLTGGVSYIVIHAAVDALIRPQYGVPFLERIEVTNLFNNCVKLLIMSNDVLIDVYGALGVVKNIQASIEKVIPLAEEHMESFDEKEVKESIGTKQRKLLAEQNLKHLKLCNRELKEIIEEEMIVEMPLKERVEQKKRALLENV